METIIATKDADFEGRLYRELNPLKEQLQIHAQTTGILVGEKAELTAALLQSQTTARQKVCEFSFVYFIFIFNDCKLSVHQPKSKN